MDFSGLLIALVLVIAVVFLAPAVARPTLGRALLGLFFVGGALVNLLYTLPHLPASLEGLVATASVAFYRGVVQAAVAARLDGILVLLVIAFEVAAGVLVLWRGPLWVVALLGHIAAGIVTVAIPGWWRLAVVVASALSLVVLALFYRPATSIGVLVDVGVLVALPWARWPTPELVGA